MKQSLANLLTEALHTLQSEQKIPSITLPHVLVEASRLENQGDYTSNIALILGKQVGILPHTLADLILERLPKHAMLKTATVAGPGFINFEIDERVYFEVIPKIFEKGLLFGRTPLKPHAKVLLEFISSNPTGPLHVGHGRSAAYGASLANILAANGFDVHTEYYVNDAGRQMYILTVSIWLRYLENTGLTFPFPANAYQGDYVKEIARTLQQNEGLRFVVLKESLLKDLPYDEPDGGDQEIYIDSLITRARTLLGEDAFQTILQFGLKQVLEDIQNDLGELGIFFHEWFSEKSLIAGGALEKKIHDLKEAGLTYEKEGALWFNATHFGDEKDRVLIRANGEPTYFASDVAYHWIKYERGYDKLINIFGADHHGYIPRLRAVISALGKSQETLDVLTVQFAILYEGKTRLSMSTRRGSFVTLRQLRQEVGNDAVRFFYIMRRAQQHMDFDLALAKSHSNENPLYYIQYAYARICSVFRQLHEKKLTFNEALGLQAQTRLTTPEEVHVAKQLGRYSEVIAAAALTYEPHLLAHYLRELAHVFHVYYNVHPFLVEDPELRNARLCLIIATQQVLMNGLTMIGVSAPEHM